MPPLAGPERDVVLHAVAGEHLDLAVVHLDGARDDDLALGMRQHLPDAGLEIENAGRAFEFLEHAGEQSAVCGHQILVTTGILLGAVNVGEAKRSKVATLGSECQFAIRCISF